MSKEIKLGRLVRDASAAEIRIERREAGGSKLSFSLSSEAEIDRWFGTEILSHDKAAVRLQRAQGGAMPLLFNHDWDDPIGMIDAARIVDKRLVVDAHFFDTDRAKEVATMIEGGLRNVSIGYQVHAFEEKVKEQVYTAVDWEPLEGSIVTVPADAGVGIGRGNDPEARVVRLISSQPAAPAASQRKATMADTNAAAGTNAEPTGQAPAVQQQTQQEPTQQTRSAPAGGDNGARALELERNRRRGIENLCKANKIDDSVREYWIGTGLSVEQITDDLLKIIEERGKNNPQSDAKLGLSAGETQRYSLFAAIRAAVDKDWSKAGFELECSRAIAQKLNRAPDPNKFFVPFEVQSRALPGKRDLTVASSASAGYLVGTDHLSFIELMRNRSVAYRMGARRLSGLVGNVSVPRQTAAASAVWLNSEASQIAETTQTFNQMTLAAKNVGAYTEISRQLLLQSSPDAEGIVSTDLASVVALAIDAAVIRGSGSSGQPQGIVGTDGVGSVTGTSLAAGGILEFQSDVAAGNFLTEGCGYVTTPAVAALLMARPELPSSGTTRLWLGSMLDGSLFGMRAMSSNQMSSGTMLFGDWSQVVIGEWGVLEIDVNPYANFQAGIVGVRAIASVDVGVRHGDAFSYSSSIT